MANFFNPANSRALNVLPVNAGRVISHTSSIIGETEVITFSSFNFGFTSAVEVQSTSSMSCFKTGTFVSLDINASTDLQSTKAIVYTGRGIKIALCKNNTFDTPVDLSSTCNNLFYTSN